MRILPNLIEDVLRWTVEGIHEDLYSIIQLACSLTLDDYDLSGEVSVTLKSERFPVKFDMPSMTLILEQRTKLATRVIRDWDDISGWQGNTVMRSEILSDCLGSFPYYEEYRRREEAILFAFQQFLLISCKLQVQDVVDGNDADLMHCLYSVLGEVRRSHSYKTFMPYLAEIKSKHLLGLHELVLDLIEKWYRSYWFSRKKESCALELDDLFRHILIQDPEEIDSDYPSTRHDQSRTLDRLIKIVHNLKKRSYDALSSWRDLVLEEIKKLDCKALDANHEGAIEVTAEVEGESGSEVVDMWNLKNCQWILDGHPSHWDVLQGALRAIGELPEVESESLSSKSRERSLYEESSNGLDLEEEPDPNDGEPEPSDGEPEAIDDTEEEKDGRSFGIARKMRNFFSKSRSKPVQDVSAA